MIKIPSYDGKGGSMNYKDAYLYLFNRITDLQEELQKLQIIAEAIVTETDSEEETTEEE